MADSGVETGKRTPGAGSVLIPVVALTALGLVIRLAASRGALWLDEAWSALNARDAGTPLAVFLRINHDNNHHLNTLWLQLVGFDAPPMLQRALSIACGTLAIPLAATIARRQGTGAALVAALLFAVSPLLVTYGAEARGYAPMLVFLLAAVLIVARWLDDPAQRVPGVLLFVMTLLGMFAQLTMAFGIAGIVLWVGWALMRSRPWRAALAIAARGLFPIVLAGALAIGTVFGAAWAVGTGLQIGNYDAFSLSALASGWGAMMFAAFGGPVALIAALALLPPPDTPGDRAGLARDRLFFLFILALPIGLSLVQAPNSGAPRYLLLSGVGALMLAAVHSGPRLAPGRAIRWLVAAALAVVTVASLVTDWRIAENRRADPGLAIDALLKREPAGTEVAVDRERSDAVLEAAAASRHYRIALTGPKCPPPPYLFVDRDGDQRFPDPAIRCGAPYHVIAEGHPTGLSGTHWKLYERGSLPK